MCVVVRVVLSRQELCAFRRPDHGLEADAYRSGQAVPDNEALHLSAPLRGPQVNASALDATRNEPVYVSPFHLEQQQNLLASGSARDSGGSRAAAPRVPGGFCGLAISVAAPRR
jgi:hypothetical protein